MENINNYKLTETITVGQTRKWMLDKDESAKLNLINLIQHRFNNRYIKHVKNLESGFLIMAISCLMIETLESFRQGRKNTKGVSSKMFKDFFNREKLLFPEFIDIADDFYSSIRCWILHQAETTNAWRILRKEKLLNKTEKSINARKFINSLDKSLENYINELHNSDFNESIWKKALFKLEDICENCNASH